jgi:metal-dependent amidase/aminoacylase/carboxypeptidase family protein
LQDKIENIFRSAAVATGCEIKLAWDKNPYLDTMNNKKMMNVFSKAMDDFGFTDFNPGVENPAPVTASTDFGNVTYAMPGIHPMYGINTPHFPHTAAFAEAAGKDDGFEASLVTAKALIVTGMSVLQDEQFYNQVVEEFKQIGVNGKTKDDSIY